jgi:hypothetical protein
MKTTIDWPHLLGDIAYLLGEQIQGSDLRIPCGTRDLAKHLGLPRMTVVGWIGGSEPKHAQGEQILAAWCLLTGKDRLFAPLTRVTYSAAKVA